MALMVVFAGCASPNHRAPVDDRSSSARSSKPPRGIENEGKPGYYTVKPGDTLTRIGVEFSQNWKDIQRWNDIENANSIEAGQVLRVKPPVNNVASTASKPSALPAPVNKPVTPAATTTTVTSKPVEPEEIVTKAEAGVVVTKGVSTDTVEERSLESKPLASASTTPKPAAAESKTSTAKAVTAPSAASATAATTSTDKPSSEDSSKSADDGLTWAWPTNNKIIGKFEPGQTRGLLFGGNAGDPVIAAADGRVIYSGSGLRGYGNLIILQHNKSFLTAYAHNQKLLVKENQVVQRGQKIAEMGSSEASQVQLLFELRKSGKPIDPVKLLPGR